VKVEEAPDGVLLTVEDTGPGIPAELRDSIFEPFRQGNTSPSHNPGVGIGLSLVARFAELHGGHAWVEEAPEGGAAFKVYLPHVVSNQDMAALPASDARPRRHGTSDRRPVSSRPAGEDSRAPTPR
jgi:signal transduction histidine kinase